MITLSRRDLDFLHESNAIENIVHIDYRDARNVSVDRGHVGAYVDAIDRAHCRVALRIDDLCCWHAWIMDEQVAFGYAAPPASGGALNDAAEVRPLLVRLLADLNARLAPQPMQSAWATPPRCAAVGRARDAALIDVLADVLVRFAAIQPFFDGNGRMARLLASYVAAWFIAPIVVFRAAERPALRTARRDPAVMRAWLAHKLRDHFACDAVPDDELIARPRPSASSRSPSTSSTLLVAGTNPPA